MVVVVSFRPLRAASAMRVAKSTETVATTTVASVALQRRARVTATSQFVCIQSLVQLMAAVTTAVAILASALPHAESTTTAAMITKPLASKVVVVVAITILMMMILAGATQHGVHHPKQLQKHHLGAQHQ